MMDIGGTQAQQNRSDLQAGSLQSADAQHGLMTSYRFYSSLQIALVLRAMQHMYIISKDDD